MKVTVTFFYLKSSFFLSIDVDVPHPDEKSIITYVSSLYDVMPRVPDVQDGVKANVSLFPPHHQFIIIKICEQQRQEMWWRLHLQQQAANNKYHIAIYKLLKF